MDSLAADAVWLRRLAGALARDDAAAEDLAQDAWLVALGRPDAERPWLRKVLLNLVRMRARSEARRRRREAERVGYDEPLGAERLAEHRRLLRLVGELDEPFRTVVCLRYLDELSSVEIARRLGASPKARSGGG